MIDSALATLRDSLATAKVDPRDDERAGNLLASILEARDAGASYAQIAEKAQQPVEQVREFIEYENSVRYGVTVDG